MLVADLSVPSPEFPAGQMVKFLVGFSNMGSQEFVIDTMEASFRYPQDFSFYIQNVSGWHISAGLEVVTKYFGPC